jgi:hypothetical protein
MVKINFHIFPYLSMYYVLQNKPKVQSRVYFLALIVCLDPFSTDNFTNIYRVNGFTRAFYFFVDSGKMILLRWSLFGK